MSYETFSEDSTVGFRADGESREAAFAEAVKAFSALVGVVGSGTERRTVSVSGSSARALLAALLEFLLELQSEAGAVVSHAHALEILDVDDESHLTAKVELDGDPPARVLDPGTVDSVDASGEAGGPWRLEATFRRPNPQR